MFFSVSRYSYAQLAALGLTAVGVPIVVDNAANAKICSEDPKSVVLSDIGAAACGILFSPAVEVCWKENKFLGLFGTALAIGASGFAGKKFADWTRHPISYQKMLTLAAIKAVEIGIFAFIFTNLRSH